MRYLVAIYCQRKIHTRNLARFRARKTAGEGLRTSAHCAIREGIPQRLRRARRSLAGHTYFECAYWGRAQGKGGGGKIRMV